MVGLGLGGLGGGDDSPSVPGRGGRGEFSSRESRMEDVG